MELLERFLDRLDALHLALPETVALAKFNAWLYLVTAHTHLGHTDTAEKLLKQCGTLLPQILERPENIDFYYILRNREAVVLQDDFRFEEALGLLEEAISVAELQEESQQELLRIIGLSGGETVPQQKAKLLGTYAQTCQYLLPQRPELHQQAVTAAQRAVDAFVHPAEKSRQYFTWAEIEAESGHPAEALDRLCDALGCAKEQLAATAAEVRDVYAWYHIIRVCRALLSGAPGQQAVAEQLFDQARRNFDTIFSDRFPAHAAAWHAAAVCSQSKRFASGRDRFYQRCCTLCFQEENLQGSLWAIGLAATAEQIALQLRAGRSPDALRQRLKQRIAQARAADLTGGLSARYAAWEGQLASAGEDSALWVKACEEIAREVPY